MAKKGTIGARIVLEGEKAYREALKGIRAEQTELRSEMKLCQSEFKTSQNSLEALTKKHEILTKGIEVQTGKIEVYRKAMEDYAGKQEQASEKVKELQTALDRGEKAMEAMGSSAGNNTRAVEEQAKVIEDLKQKLALAEEGFNKAEQKTKGYQASLNNATAELNEMKADLAATSRYMAEAENSADKCAKSIDAYGKETQAASEKTNIFGDVLKANLTSEVIIAGAKKLASGIKEIADSAIETGSSFEASMSQVAATMGITVEEIAAGSKSYELLAESAKSCGATTKYSASEAAEALNYLALAGYDAAKSAETLPKVLDLAAAGGLDLAYASDLVTDSMAALGLETNQLDGYIDQMTKTSQKSNTSVAQLGEATLVCAGTVSMAGQSIETMNAELGILANNGIKGAEGGTHLRNVILSLSAPTDTAALAIKKLGLQIHDEQGNMRDLNDILTDMNKEMSGMSAAEKTDLISRIFNKTDISAVNALLKGTGREFDSLTAELRDCDGAAADMADTMNNNLKGKVTILKSSLEALGISAYEIFDNEMKEAVDGASEAVGRLQMSIEEGDLGVSLNKMSEALGGFLESAIDVGEDALPVLIDGLTWLLDNADLVIAGVTGIVTANVAMNTAVPAIEAVSTAWAAFKEKNEAATVSQWLLNAAMEANPAGILLTAIVGLTAAVGAYILINKDNLSVMDETTRKTREMVEDVNALNDAYADSATDRQKSRDEMELEASQAKKLADELRELAEKTSRTHEEEVRMKMIVEQLNQIIPDLNLAINEQTGELNMSTDAIYLNIDAMMALGRAKAAREDLTKITKEQWEAEKKLAELRDQEQEQYTAMTEAQAAYNTAAQEQNARMLLMQGATMDQTDKLMRLESELYNSKAAYESIQATIADTEATIESYRTEYASTLEYITEQESMAKGSVEELGDAAVGTAEDFREMQEGVTASAAEMATGVTSAYADMETGVTEAFQEMYASVSESIEKQTNLFTKFKGESELSTKELLENMQSQVDGITKWADNLEELAERGIDQGLLKHLADMGPAGAGYAAAFASMTDEELQKANEMWGQSLVMRDETASRIAASYEAAGKGSADGYSDGIEKQMGTVERTSGEMADRSLKGMNVTLGISGGAESRAFMDIGESADRGFASGVRNALGDVTAQVTALGYAALSACQTAASKSDYESIGENIPRGMASGIRAKIGDAVAAARDMVAQVLAESKKGLDINSPSKKFEYMGEMSGEGYIVGWEKSMANINAVIADSLPDTSMTAGTGGNSLPSDSMPAAGKKIEVNQEINIYSLEDDPMDAARKFRNSQREAAEEW